MAGSEESKSGMAAGDDELPAQAGLAGFRMAGSGLKKRSAQCQAPESLISRFAST